MHAGKVGVHTTGVDRLTFSVVWEMTGEGRILKQWSGQTVIRSCAKLAYDHVQAMIEGSFDASKPPVPLGTPHTWDQVCADEDYWPRLTLGPCLCRLA